MATPIVQTWARSSTTSGQNLSCTAPSGIAANDFLVIFIGNRAGSPQFSIITGTYPGWALLKEQGNSSSGTLAIFAKLASGSESTVVVDGVASSQHIIAWYIRISGMNASSPNYRWNAAFDQLDRSSYGSTASDLVAGNYLQLAVAGTRTGAHGGFTTSALFTEKDDYITTATSSGLGMVWATASFTGPGLSKNCTFTKVDSGGTGGMTIGVMALNDAPFFKVAGLCSASSIAKLNARHLNYGVTKNGVLVSANHGDISTY